MVFFTHRNLLLSLWITTGLSVCLAIYGGIAAYSPVPFWDMWDHLDLAAKAPTGGLQVWWEQHNEHRIVLAKVLFLVDQSYFHGNQWFLILANYLIVALSCVVFVVLLKEQLGEDADPIPLRVLSLILVTMLVSWIQIDNLTWAFQSQFFLAQLLPLIALFLLFKSAAAPAHSRGLFILACGVGFISIGTMANGVLALPLMLGLSLILRVTRMRLAILALVAIAGVSLYFFDYHGVSTHGNPGDAGRNAPGDIIRYVLLYLGGPFYFFTFGSKAAAYTAGAFLVCSSVVFALQCMRSPRVGGGQIVTLAFLAYLGATALVTAAGRLSFGVDQALAGRYQTPALMAWAALLILYAPSFSRLLQRQPVQGISLALMIALLLLPQQLTAIKNKQDYLFDKFIAALALELGVKDRVQIQKIFPDYEHAMDAAAPSIAGNSSVFSDFRLRDARKLIGTTERSGLLAPCQGGLDSAVEIADDDRYVRVSGWAFHPGFRVRPLAIHLLNADNRIVGYALTGHSYADSAGVSIDGAGDSGFKGYLLKEMLGQAVILQGIHPDCNTRDTAPVRASTPGH